MNDEWSLSAWDDAGGLFLLVRFAVLADRGVTTGGVLAWVAARPAYSYGHAVEEAGGPGADGGLRAGGIALREEEPGRWWSVELTDGAHRMALRWESFTGAHPVGPGRTGRTCRVRGTVVIGGVAIDVDGVGQRTEVHLDDAVDGAPEAHVVSGFLGPAGRPVGQAAVARSVQVRQAVDPTGASTAVGYVHDGGADAAITGLERTTELDDDGAPARFLAAVATTAGGPAFEIRGLGHGAGVPIAGPDGAVTHLRLMRMETDDGLDGYGLYERSAGVVVP